MAQQLQPGSDRGSAVPEGKAGTRQPLGSASIASRLQGGVLGFAFLAAAFGVGLSLGHMSPSAPPGDETSVAEVFGPTSRTVESASSGAMRDSSPSREASSARHLDFNSAAADLEVVAAESPASTQDAARAYGRDPSRKLRLRSTALVSSEQAKAGDAVLFVTENRWSTLSGQLVPAGALVQAVVSRAARSTENNPGSLVIEIRALYVGNRIIPLHALPHVSVPLQTAESVGTAGESPLPTRDPKQMQIRTQYRLMPEAVVPRQSVIEFELVETDDGFGTQPAEPLVPSPSLRAPESPAPAVPPNLDIRPGRTSSGAGIKTAAG